MIEVRVRHIADGDAQVLGEFSPSEVPAVVDIFKGTQTYSQGDGFEYDPASFYCTQFVFSMDGPFFEIIVGRLT